MIDDRIHAKDEKADFSKLDASELTLVGHLAMDENVITSNIVRVLENNAHTELIQFNRGMGNLLERPDLVAGVAAVSSNLPTPNNMDCAAKNVPTPVMTINGTADPVALYNGGQRPGGTNGPSMSTDETMAYFTKLNGQDGLPEVTRLPHVKESDPTSVERSAWMQPGKPPVVLYTIHGGGHVVPQPHYRYPRNVGRMTEDLNAPDVIWEFFSKLPPRE